MSDEWFYAQKGKQFGPISKAELVQLAGSGGLSPKCLAWTHGMEEWVPISQLGLDAPPRVIRSARRSKVESDDGMLKRRTQERDDEVEEPPRPQDADTTRSVKYIMEDRNWLSKAIAGGLLISFPILEAVCDGYQIRTIKNIRTGRRFPLPKWQDLGGLFLEGIKLRLVIYAMYIPTICLEVFTVLVDIAWIADYFIKEEDHEKFKLGHKVANFILKPLLNLFVLVLQIALFMLVPALARRAADGVSFGGLFNPVPAIRLMFDNFSLYLTARITVFGLLILFSIMVGVVSGIGWVVVIGPIIGWLIMGIGRFWGRQTWAYYLAHMKGR